MPLPMFLLIGSNIYEHYSMAVESNPYEVPVLGITMPIMIFYLLGNVVSQYPFSYSLIFSHILIHEFAL